MKLNYTITEDDYTEIIEYQMTLQKNKKSKVIQYWLSNLIFMAAALYFLIARSSYAWWLRLAPLVMALILLGITTYRRQAIPQRARRAIKSYVRSGTLAKGFIGPHTMLIEGTEVKRGFGGDWTNITCNDIVHMERLKRSTILIANAAIFELIPNTYLDEENRRMELAEILNLGSSAKREKAAEDLLKSLPGEEEIRMMKKWSPDKASYENGIVWGHRYFYGTMKAWKGSPMVRMIILIYGLVVLIGGWSVYIGLAFLLIGIMLNRQLFTAFSPLAYRLVDQTVSKTAGSNGDIGDEVFYITKDELMVTFCNQLQKTKLADIVAKKSGKGYNYFYTNNGQMYVVPDSVFVNDSEKQKFYELLS